MGKQTKQKTSNNEESLLNKIKQLEADNFLLSNPQGLTTVGPLPSTSGGNASPTNATSTGTGYNPATGTLSQNIAHMAGVTPNSTTQSSTVSGTQPAFSPTTSYRNSSSFNQSESIPVIMNAEAIAKAEAQKIEEERKADEYNATLADRINVLNSTVSKPGRRYDDMGKIIPSTYTPMAPLPVMPKEVEIPNMVVANHSKSYGESKSEGGGGGLNPPKINPDIPLFYRDANGKIAIKYAQYDSPEATQKSNDQVETEWLNQQDLLNMKDQFLSSAYRNEGADLKNNTWKLKSYNGSKDGKASEVSAGGDLFDMARANVLTEMLDKNPNTVVIKAPDGRISKADKNVAKNTSAQNFRFDETKIWKVTKDPKTGEMVKTIGDPNAYNSIKNGISNFLSLNGWKQGSKPDRNSPLFSYLQPDLQKAILDNNIGRKSADVLRRQMERAIMTYLVKANQ